MGIVPNAPSKMAHGHCAECTEQDGTWALRLLQRKTLECPPTSPGSWEEKVVIDVWLVESSLSPVKPLGVLPDPDGLLDAPNGPITLM